VFKAMHGEPVTIRTIDPPLHEFLPKREELMVEIASWRRPARDGKELEEKKTLLARVEQLHEFNPMLGHRGVPARASPIPRSPRCRRAPSSRRPAS
jgi:pyruvate, orthophosphate dikinase